MVLDGGAGLDGRGGGVESLEELGSEAALLHPERKTVSPSQQPFLHFQAHPAPSLPTQHKLLLPFPQCQVHTAILLDPKLPHTLLFLLSFSLEQTVHRHGGGRVAFFLYMVEASHHSPGRQIVHVSGVVDGDSVDLA